jgi:hypothetical protein
MSSRRFRLGLVVFGSASALMAGGLFASMPGCTVLTNDAPLDDSGVFEGGGDASSPACTSCVTQECTGTWAVCLTDSRCVALRACNNPFGESEGSRTQCFCSTADAGGTPDGGVEALAAYAAFAACNDARTCGKCATDCSATCTGGTKSTAPGACGEVDAGDSGTSNDAATDPDADPDAGEAGAPDADVDSGVSPPIATGVDACASCVSGKCGDAKKSCALGSECNTYLGCAYACADAACVDACGKSYATGKASALELSSCTLTSCRSACGL